ncbi:hypothetical protein POVWA2_040220 [Plasmodium ovale wallikeri]|uniref:Uncharacterized protein n=1 Tax=Plasmodium ovale wallikeri TaxID=864142 RepID=A0A1A8ZA06_PLAOA|nr:hypothetical protein POVWA1_041660 [Plasmodium ovale wallikeri]SBT40665.1 hypothetical protein POVWA2_040220 [Plasmodium ovale wallikeri]
MRGLLRRKAYFSAVLLLICTRVGLVLNIRKGNYAYREVAPFSKKIHRKPLYIVKYETNDKKLKVKVSKLYETKKDRPERKLDCYELNIRNDKKFPKYAKKPVSPMSNLFYFSPFKNIISSFPAVNYNIKNKLREEGFQFQNERSDTNMFPSLDDIIKNGDPSTNIHFYRRKKLKSLLYRDPLKFTKTRKVVEKYNRKAPPDKQINYDLFRCDIFHVHSDGTIMNIEENRPPYEEKLEESEKNKEPRFLITTATSCEMCAIKFVFPFRYSNVLFSLLSTKNYLQPGHAKQYNLKVGDKFPAVNEDHKRMLYDNHFAKPKKIRDPLILPGGRRIP